MCFTQVGSGLTRNYWTRLERLARDKHASLLRKSVNYVRKKFYSTGPGFKWLPGMTPSCYFVTPSVTKAKFYGIDTWAQCYKTFSTVIINFLYLARFFCPWEGF
jgi:hypothetical protein